MSENPVSEIERGYQTAVRFLNHKEYDLAAEEFENLLPILDEVGDYLGQARVFVHLGQIHEILEEPEDAEERYREALDLAHMISDRGIEAHVAHRLGHLLRMSDPAEARTLFVTSLECCEAIEDVYGQAVSLGMIGQIDFRAGEQEEGMRQMLDAFRLIPPDADERSHLLEHLVYFSEKMPGDRFRQLVDEALDGADLRDEVWAEAAKRANRKKRKKKD
jgi:tetratricopeptide (TPR) repeat protein